jgi:cell division protein FtsI (penicillin-binding protein 3)
MTIQIPNKRKLKILSFAFLGALLCFLLLEVQFFRLQVFEHEKWKKRGENQYFFYVKEPFRRGAFYANTSLRRGEEGKAVPFTIDVPLYHLYADSKTIPPEVRKEVCERVLKILSPKLKEATKLIAELKRKSRSRRLVSHLSEHEKVLFCSWWYPFAKEHGIPSNALFFVSDFKRFHPMGHLLGQTLHTIQERRDEVTGKAYPTGGLELSLNKLLEGSMGLRRLMRSPRNSLETGDVLKEPVDGLDIELTINHVIQAIVEEELERGVQQARAKGGMAVMVEPRTGQILALAQYPFFNPDHYQEYFNDKKLVENTKMKAQVDAYEPGSPMKAFTISLALKANKILKEQGKKPFFAPLEKIATSSGNFPGRKKAMTDVHFHRFLNMYMGIQKSSNIYVATIGGRMAGAMGDAWYRNELEKTFGLGTKTGIELCGESSGVLPTPGKLHANGTMEWSKGTPNVLAIGYNVQVTALQMARAYSVIASGGVLPELTLVRRVFKRTKDGKREVIFDNSQGARVKNFPRVMDEDIVNEIKKAMKYVTKPGGSASKADIHGYTECGKTGTSMKLVGGKYSEKAHIVSFVGFAPADVPAFVLYICLDEPYVGYIPGRGTNHRGGTSAAPIFPRIGRRVLEFLGIPMDDPHGFPPQDPRRDPKKADWMKETEALESLYKAWNGS